MNRTVIFIRLLRESFISAFISLITNKLRTFLSLMGITIGIFAIVSVFTVIDAMENFVKDSIKTLGDNMVYVQKWPWGGGGEYPWWKYLSRPEPTLAESEEILRRSNLTEAVAFGVGGNRTVHYKNNYIEELEVAGYSHDYEKIRSFEMESGRYFSLYESNTGKPRAVIGSEAAKQLFQNENPVGKEIKIDGKKILVIGVFKKEGEDMFDVSNDKRVILPINYVKYIFNLNQDNIGKFVMVKAKPNITTDELIDELRGIMRSIRRLKPTEEDDFALNKSSLVAEAFKSIFSIIDITGIIIGGFSILVGGFGIANIMFVSVKEQTKLIGIQKALGAKNYFILLQFLYEAVVLSLIGGILGLLLIFIGTILVGKFSDMSFSLSMGNIVFGLVISISVGIISGFMPARKAARLNPVEAIASV